jgi:UDP-N-acetylglucosamine acyltransferase
MIGDGRNGGVKGYNIVGMKRSGFSMETVRAIKDIYQIYFRSGLNSKNAIAKIEAELQPLPEVLEFLEFVKSSTRGVLCGHREGRRA